MSGSVCAAGRGLNAALEACVCVRAVDDVFWMKGTADSGSPREKSCLDQPELPRASDICV